MTDRTTVEWMLTALDVVEATAHNDVHGIDLQLADYDREDLTELAAAFGVLFLMVGRGDHILHHLPKLRKRVLALPPDPVT